MTTDTPTHPRQRDDEPFVCQQCGGPCRAYAGNVHGWTCQKCLRRYVTAQTVALDYGIKPKGRADG